MKKFTYTSNDCSYMHYWYLQSGLVDNMAKVIKEYKEVRGLLPIFACILGPPAVGKTFVIRQLCQHYKLHHVMIADVIKEAIETNVSEEASYVRMGMTHIPETQCSKQK